MPRGWRPSWRSSWRPAPPGGLEVPRLEKAVPLEPRALQVYRSTAARAKDLSLDRPGVADAAKECCGA